MTYFISIEELKQNNVINANVDSEYIEPALKEAQAIFLKELIGDALYTVIENKINGNTLTGKYQTLVNDYIKPYLEMRMLSSLVVPISMKIRNAGVIQQYDQGFNSSNVKDVSYLADYYNGRVEFYENRMTEYLKKNINDIPEYAYSNQNVTNPSQTHTAGTIYLGGNRKRSCGANYGGSGGGTATTVDWDNITNRPDFAQVAYSNDYNDLDNKPEIPSLEGYATETYVTNAVQQVEGEIPTVPTNVSAFTNDAGYTTFDGDYNSLTNKPTIPAAQVNSDWNSNSGVSQILNKPNLGDYVRVVDYNVDKQSIDNALNDKVDVGTYNNKMSAVDNALADKVETGNLCRINNERLDTNSNFELVRTDSIATLTIKQGGTTKGTFTPNSGTDVEINLDAGGGGGSTDWSDITNKPSFAVVATSGDYGDLTNKPIIPVVPTNVSAFTNDAGYLTQHQSLAGYATETWVQQQGYSTFDGDYNSLNNKPTIPAAQVNSDWNANSGVAQILNKPSMTAETWTFILSDNTTVTKTVWLQ